MDTKKDYYAILGVLPTAEDVVIRAAYKALAQRYHPDRFSGSQEEANRYMADLNLAYSILSDSLKRAEYDRLRGENTKSGDAYFNDDEPPQYDPLKSDWDTVVEYYPDLKELEFGLSNISWRLAYSFRAHLLETKSFEQREKVSEAMERQFLEVYFGANPKIIAFAKELIRSRNKPAARALNKAIRVLGDKIDTARVIGKIKTDYDLTVSNARNVEPDEPIIVKSCSSCRSINAEDLLSCSYCGAPLPV